MPRPPLSTTANPSAVLTAVTEFAQRQAWRVWLSFADVDPLGMALRRLLEQI